MTFLQKDGPCLHAGGLQDVHQMPEGLECSPCVPEGAEPIWEQGQGADRRPSACWEEGREDHKTQAASSDGLPKLAKASA